MRDYSRGILDRLRWRKMGVDLPNPVSEDEENDDQQDLVDGAHPQLWRFRRFVGRKVADHLALRDKAVQF